jgi:hypothetical protein
MPDPTPTPCGGCGATEERQRCIGCFHDFGSPKHQAGAAPTWDGLPNNPERDGWHWVGGYPRLWDGMRGIWWQRLGGPTMAHGCAPTLWGEYGGPCLRPSEVAASRADALREAADMFRSDAAGEAARNIILSLIPQEHRREPR